MAITVSTFGRNVINEKFILEAVTDNPTDVKFMRLEINNFTLENEPEVGTNDTFRFELTAPLWVSISNTFPELLTYDTANNNTEIEGAWSNLTLTELEADGTTADTLNKAYYLKPFNFFRSQAFADFDCGDDGSSASKFLTNSPTTIRVKYDDFMWLFVDQADFTGSASNQEIVIQNVIEDGTVVNTDTYDIGGTAISPLYAYLPNVVASGKPHPVGFQIKFTDYLTNDCDRILVFVRDKSGATQRSEVKIFREYTGCEYVKLWWLNQYNAPELTYMDGQEVREVSNEQKGYIASEPVNPTYLEGGRKVFANNVSKTHLLNTGNRTPKEIEYLSEMLYSRELAIEKDGVLTAVRITNSNIKNYNSKDSVFNLEITVEEIKDTIIY